MEKELELSSQTAVQGGDRTVKRAGTGCTEMHSSPNVHREPGPSALWSHSDLTDSESEDPEPWRKECILSTVHVLFKK